MTAAPRPAPESPMTHRDVVVVGASAGGVEALRQLVGAWLPAILARCTELPVRHARHGEPLRPGEIVVGPPDQHLLVPDGHLVLSRGPQENGHRPAVDVLLRSAALAAGPRVVRVVLSGARDDGTAGAAAVVRQGGIALVQEPTEAPHPTMPRNVLDQVPGAEAYPVLELGKRIVEVVSRPVRSSPAVPADSLLVAETGIATLDTSTGTVTTTDQLPSRPVGFGCPSCHGALCELPRGADAALPVPHRPRLVAREPARRAGRRAGGGTLVGAAQHRGEGGARRPDGSAGDERGSARTAARYAGNGHEAQRAAELLRELIGKLGPAGVPAGIAGRDG